MIEQDLFKDQHISTQYPVAFRHPTHGECYIIEDPATPTALFPDHVKIWKPKAEKTPNSITPIHREFIVPRTSLKAPKEEK